MDTPRESWSRLRSWMGRDAMEREMDEEMRFHIEQQTEKNVRAGMPPDEARRAALLSFGAMERFKEESREESRPRRLEDLVQDLRFGLRTLARSPGFTLVAVLTLALGIGANTAIFSVVDGVLLRPVPLDRADRLMVIWETDRDSSTTREPSSIPDFLDFQVQSRTFEKTAAFAGAEVNLTPLQGEPERLAALAVSHGYLPMVGVPVLHGRGFSAEDDRPGAPDVALISEGLWQRLFDRDPAALGRPVRLDDRPVTVIGVVPDAGAFGSLQILSAADYSRAFADRGRDTRAEVFLPLRPDPQESPRDSHPIFVLGRLAPGAAMEAAQREMDTIASDLERQYPANKARGVHVEPFHEVVFGPIRPALLILLGAVGLVLLAACANLANLLFARGSIRLREVAVRTALGAGWRRLVHQFLVESTLLTLAGVGLGLLFAFLGLELLIALAPSGIPRLAEATINGRVLWWSLGASALVALAVGLMPVMQARRANLHAMLKEEGRGATTDPGRSRLRAALVMAELALAVVLLAGAGLLLKSFWLLRQVDPGFRVHGVLKAEFQLPETRYPTDFKRWPDWPEQRRFYEAVLERVLALPGVEAASVAGNHPLDPGFTNSFTVVGREQEAKDWPEISIRRVDAGYFETLGVPLVRGRLLRAADDAKAPPVLLINEGAARRFFPDRNPLGQQIAFWGSNRTVVGVVRDERSHGLTADPPPAVYPPVAQCPFADGSGVLLVRAQGDLAALTPAIRAAFREVDPELAIFGVEPLETTLTESLARQRFTMLLVTVFAGLTLVLAVVGVYGILSYIVAQRTPEMGIRMAMGAGPGDVVRLIVLQGARLAFQGLVLGLAGAFVLMRFLQGLLFGVGAADPAIFTVVLVLVFAAAVAASWLPARRATRRDPMRILRAS